MDEGTLEALQERYDLLSVRERMARRGRREPERRPQPIPTSLAEALAAAGPPTPADPRRLADRAVTGPVVSCYMRFGPDRTGQPRAHLTKLRSLVDSARHRQLVELPKEHRDQVEGDLVHLVRAISELDPAGARALVAFRSGEELNAAYRLPLPAPGPDRVTLGPEPYLSPLTALLDEHPPVLVVSVTKREARLFLAHFGQLTEIDRLTAFVTGDRIDVPRPGKDQRRRLTHLQWHLRDTAHAAALAHHRHQCRGVIVAGDQPVRMALTEFLPPALAHEVLGGCPEPRSQTDLAHRVVAILTERRGETEQRWAEELAARAAEGRLRAGLPAVVDAVDQFLAGQVAVAARPGPGGYLCPAQHTLALTLGTCPYCGASLIPVDDAVDELVDLCLRYGIERRMFVVHPELLDRYGGVAAVVYPAFADVDAGGAPGGAEDH